MCDPSIGRIAAGASFLAPPFRYDVANLTPAASPNERLRLLWRFKSVQRSDSGVSRRFRRKRQVRRENFELTVKSDRLSIKEVI